MMRVWLTRGMQTVLLTFGFMAVSVFAAGSVFAATRTWDGTTDVSCDEAGEYVFSTAACWEEDAAPVDGDDLVFTLGTVSASIEQDIVALEVNSLDVNGTLSGGVAPTLMITGATGFGFSGSTPSALVTLSDAVLDIQENVTLMTDTSVTFETVKAGLIFDASIAFDLGANDLLLVFEDAVTLTKDSDPETDLPVVELAAVLTGTTASTINGTGIVLDMIGNVANNSVFNGQYILASSRLALDNVVDIGGSTLIGVDLNHSQLYIDAAAAFTLDQSVTFDGNLFDDTTAGNTGRQTAAILAATDENVNFTGSLFKLESAIVYQIESSNPLPDPLARLNISPTALEGSYFLKPTADDEGGVLKMDADTNTSKMPNGEYTFLQGTSNDLTGDSAAIDLFVENGAVVTIAVDAVRGSVVLESGATLKGNGTVGDVLAYGGSFLMPGASPGCLTTADLSLTSGVTYTVEINGATRCTEYDQTVVIGTVTLNDATLAIVLGETYDPVNDTTFVIIDNDGTDAVVGTFNGLAQGASVTVGSQVFTISYAGGTDGNDVVLTAVTTPGAPDTGFGMVTTGFIGLVVITLLSAGFIYFAAQRAKKTV